MTMTDLGGASGAPRPTGRHDEASVKDVAGAALETVKAETASFAAAAQDKVAEKVTEHTATATQTLGDFAGAIRKAGEELAQHDQSVAGRMVKQAADGLESLTRSIADKRPEELLDTVRDFGRKNPAAFIAGSVLLGMALGRVAKSTEQRSGPAESEPAFRSPTEYLASSRPDVEAGLGGDDREAPAPSLPPYGVASGPGV